MSNSGYSSDCNVDLHRLGGLVWVWSFTRMGKVIIIFQDKLQQLTFSIQLI